MRLLLISLCGFLFSVRAFAPTGNGFYYASLSAQYVSNFDGDTITVNLPYSIPDVFSRAIPVRVRHIDTPEMTGDGKCEKDLAQKAKDVVASLLKNAKRIELKELGRDKYFRLLSKVVVTTKEGKKIVLSDYLLTKKYAVPYEGGTKNKIDWCKVK